MNIFKKLSLKSKEQESQNVNVPENKKEQEAQKPDPHKDGGCCGSCGGQQGKGL